MIFFSYGRTWGSNLRILLVTRSINKVLGGLEKQILSIAEGLANLNHQVFIVSLDSGDVKPFYEHNEHPNIQWIGLGIGDPASPATFQQKLRRQISLFQLIRKLKPDIAISFMIGAFIYSRCPTFVLRVPLILAERNSPDIYSLTSAKRWRYLYFLLMVFATRVTIQFSEYSLKYPRFLQKKLISIPNSIGNPTFKKRLPSEELTFVYGGRFSFQKRIDLLIRSFDLYKQLGGTGSLILFGNGEQEGYLRHIVRTLKTPSVSFHPPVTDANEVLAKADINCLLSIWEGFPNFLAEGLKAGIPGLGILGCDGVSQLISNGDNGWLVPSANIEEIAKIMLSIECLSDLEYQEMSHAAISSVDAYRRDEIMSRWERLLKDSVRA